MENNKTDSKKKKTNCECCQYYAFDDDIGAYICMRELDEDEMESFVNERNRECPYFNFFDEYKLVQNKTDMRKVIVTGGSRGIGAAVVKRFCENRDSVAFIYRSDSESAETISKCTGAIAVRADISDASDAVRGMETAVSALGGVDVLVCSAGIAQIKLFTDLTDEDWRHMIDTDLSGAFYACRAAAREMIKKQYGKIVCIGSMWGRAGASCEVHYSAAKAGLRGMIKALAKELGPSNITVNCIEPGVIDTDMNALLDAETRTALIESTPLCRIGTPDDVASAALFLASDEASFITGQCLGVDGGFIS